MIHKITLNGIACYKQITCLETDKKVNLIYGLNGTGKSTFSNYLYTYNGDKKNSLLTKTEDEGSESYLNCSVDGVSDDEEILVYNQDFIRDNFYESENLKGIFSLSKGNKEAKEKTDAAETKIRKKETDKTNEEVERQRLESDWEEKERFAQEMVWEIKKNYAGGDRVLEYCLDGLKRSKIDLFNHILQQEKPIEKPLKTIDQIRGEVQLISGINVQKINEIIEVTFSGQNVETNGIFAKEIVGNKNSSVADFIEKMKNADWVNSGLKYVNTDIKNGNVICPFCQQGTISSDLLKEIESYFDEQYQKDIYQLKELIGLYEESKNCLLKPTAFKDMALLESAKNDFELKYNLFVKVLNDNLEIIKKKIEYPSVSVVLESSELALKKLNLVIKEANLLIRAFNKKIDEKEATLSDLRDTFWRIMRWEYNETINRYNIERKVAKIRIGRIDSKIKTLLEEIKTEQGIITEQQKNVINIEVAIDNINAGLIDLGIADFKIEKHKNEFYKIVRGDRKDRIFRSLSEGEKMIISFLYFIELCHGKTKSAELVKKKIIVIDDPISSLSHIYIFNIGRLIHHEFLRTEKYEQIFILTHSLYFFYELTNIKHDERERTQSLYRLIKNSDGSKFKPMHYQEIQNDYQAYWTVVKDNTQSPALIANCMRNIVEYFFCFVEKTELNAVFAREVLKLPKYQAFYRYMNRESHSIGQNIMDLKEFDYEIFKEALGLLFKETGYEKHYEKMIK